MKEKLILQIMKECEADGEPITREEAEEMAEMEIKAKGLKHYEQSEKPRKKPTRERKVDTDKHELMQCVKFGIEEIVQNLQVKTENECSFSYNGCEYSLKIIKHRPKK